jgi:hypothetical protein
LQCPLQRFSLGGSTIVIVWGIFIMARPERKDVDYFPHEVNHGKKMFIIEQKYGNDGYAVWFKLLEQLGKAENHYIDVREDTSMMYLESVFKTDQTIPILDDLAKLGAIDKDLWEQRIIWSQKFVDSVSDAYRNRNNKCQDLTSLLHHLSIKQRKKPTSNGINTPQKPLKDRIVKERIVKESTVVEVLDPYPFSEFWEVYDKKVGKKEKVEKKWDKLSEAIRKQIIEYIPYYRESQPDKKYRKNPETFLNNESWNDEIIKQKRTRSVFDEL